MNSFGLFGGTYNPLHIGHLQVAKEVMAGFNLEKVYFIPSAVPPHKGIDNLADAKDRYQMITGAMAPGKGFVASDVEIHRQGPSYTIDTVRYFKNQFPVSTCCYLMVGLDAFLEIETWKSFEKLFDLIPFVVMTRPSPETKQTADLSGELLKYIHLYIDEGYEFIEQSSCFVHPAKQSVHLFHVAPIDISSTQIRNFIRQGVSIKRMVPDTIEKYIHKKGLYL